MIKMIKKTKSQFNYIALILIFVLGLSSSHAQLKISPKDNFEATGFTKVGKGVCFVNDGTLISRDAYASFGNTDWKNYHVSFEAKVPSSEELVQIWASFREQGRNERYIVGIKGGLQNDIEIGRMGLMGDDAFLGIRNLDFSPALDTWYKISIEVCKNRIRVFLNDEGKPRIDVIDENAHLLPSGKIGLGGSWIQTEFRNLEVKELPENYLDGIAVDEYNYYSTKEEKKIQRKKERGLYKPIVVSNINATRTEISLDGNWLFKPAHEIENNDAAFSATADDKDWHILEVPNFWNPSRIWLHGETFMEQNFPKGVSDTYYQKETDRCENYTFDYKQTKIGWYRQWMELPETIHGKHLELSFDAVSKVAEVYVNGKKAGSHIGMFGEFIVDITKLAKPGKNLVAVKVMLDYVKDIENANNIATIAVTVEVTNQMLKDLPHGFFRGNPSGIWQPVKLVITEPIKIEDVYIKPSLTGADFQVTIKNYNSKKTKFNINTNILDHKTNNLLASETSLSKLELNAGEEKVFLFKIDGLQPKLWTPTTPHLYDFNFTVSENKTNAIFDTESIVSGFRTFETRGDFFYLNDNQYWLRAANHTPHALGINDEALANKTMQLYHDGNIAVTRSHTIPYSKVWLDAADKNGVGVSFEGTWPWLMIGVGENSIPKEELLNIWKQEWLDLMKKYRNHPSLFYWTINNEMNFTHNKDDVKRIETKMGIVSDVVKDMRALDPTRPICFDSGYTRQQVEHDHDDAFFETFDDGDIDDGHNYSGWYHSSLFDNFSGKQFMERKTEGRPLISQEWSTGYPNTETGHHTRSYLWQHQNTQTHVGNQAYPFGDPKYSLENNAFLSSELAEAVRRSHDKLAGLHNFSSITWFRNVYDAQRVEPYPTYYRMKNALNPVLVSAELWGRHFYTEEKLPTRFCIVNDKVDGTALGPSTLIWEITYKDGRVVGTGNYQIPEVVHYSRHWLTPEIMIPDSFKGDRLDGKLKLSLVQHGKEVSRNEYDLVFAKKSYVKSEDLKSKKIAIVDFSGKTKPVLDLLDITYSEMPDISRMFKQKANLYIISGIETISNLTENEQRLITDKLHKGAKIFMLNTGKKVTDIFPDHISNYLEKTLETAHIDIPESDIFNDIKFMDFRYFNNNKSEKPLVYNGLMQVYKKDNITSLVSGCEHKYARGSDQRAQLSTMKGFPMISIENGGKVVLSEMRLDKGLYDPVAAKILSNIIMDLIE